MVTWRTRGETVGLTEGVRLRAIFQLSGQPVELDAFPSVTILSPTGLVVIDHATTGVYRTGNPGEWGYDFVTGLNTYPGVYKDSWIGAFNQIPITATFDFIVYTTQLPAISTDGFIHPGDRVGIHYNQTELANINSLMRTLRARLKSEGLHRTTINGEVAQVDCDIFSVDSMISALANSLSEFNQIPHFTMFTFNDTEIIQQFHAILVQGAVLLLLGGQALIERGREYNISDNSLSLQIPTVSELLNTEWQTELNNYTEKVKMIKGNMKPSSLGLGSLSLANGGARSQIQRLRLLRERRII